jgi:hypothetical protein
MKGKTNMNKLIQLFGLLIIIGSIGITTAMINPSEKTPEIPNLDFNPETSDVESISGDLSDSDIISVLGEEGIEAINVIMQKANEILKTNNMQIEEETIKVNEVTNYKTIITNAVAATGNFIASKCHFSIKNLGLTVAIGGVAYTVYYVIDYFYENS